MTEEGELWEPEEEDPTLDRHVHGYPYVCKQSLYRLIFHRIRPEECGMIRGEVSLHVLLAADASIHT